MALRQLSFVILFQIKNAQLSFGHARGNLTEDHMLFDAHLFELSMTTNVHH